MLGLIKLFSFGILRQEKYLSHLLIERYHFVSNFILQKINRMYFWLDFRIKRFYNLILTLLRLFSNMKNIKEQLILLHLLREEEDLCQLLMIRKSIFGNLAFQL